LDAFDLPAISGELPTTGHTGCRFASRNAELNQVPLLKELQGMIPHAINAEHVRAAIREIDAAGVPTWRESTRYHLVYHHSERKT